MKGFPMTSKLFRVLVLALLTLAFTGAALAQNSSGITVYAVTTDNSLISFSSTAPGTTLTSAPISGVQDGEQIVGLDFRPANGQLIGLGSTGRLYRLNTGDGSAVALGGQLSTALNGSAFGFDFNPTVDRIRLTSDALQNLRLNQNNGTVAAIDGTLGFASPDANNPATPQIVASAYTNSFNNSTSTTLYNIDAGLDILVSQNPPNAGTLNTIGALGVDATAQTSFDIFSDGLGSDIGYASIGGGFYFINLASGAASFIGSIGSPVRAIAVTGSTSPIMSIPMCADFNGSTRPSIRAEIPAGALASGAIFCRSLVENRQFIGTAAAQIGVQSVLDAGVIQAADVFVPDATSAPTFGSAVKVCLQGDGNFIFLSAQQTPRQPAALQTTSEGGYTCAFITSPGTAVLTGR
jgi:hypothetical protein